MKYIVNEKFEMFSSDDHEYDKNFLNLYLFKFPD